MNLQASVSGFGHESATVMGTYDTEVRTLIIAKVAKKFYDERYKDCAVVTNSKIKEWDSWFTEDNLMDAIAGFNRLLGEGRLKFAAEGQRANPQNVLQLLKINASGRKYEISPDIRNMHIGVLMLAWYVETALAIKDAFDFGDELARLQSGELLTI